VRTLAVAREANPPPARSVHAPNAWLSTASSVEVDPVGACIECPRVGVSIAGGQETSRRKRIDVIRCLRFHGQYLCQLTEPGRVEMQKCGWWTEGTTRTWCHLTNSAWRSAAKVSNVVRCAARLIPLLEDRQSKIALESTTVAGMPKPLN